jgi:hypothetical protein
MGSSQLLSSPIHSITQSHPGLSSIEENKNKQEHERREKRRLRRTKHCHIKEKVKVITSISILGWKRIL